MTERPRLQTPEHCPKCGAALGDQLGVTMHWCETQAGGEVVNVWCNRCNGDCGGYYPLDHAAKPGQPVR